MGGKADAKGRKRKTMSAKRSNYISVINVISALAVVILHANSSFWSYSKDGYWGVANVIETVFYFAVPMFFMMTGATLIDYRKRYTTKTYFKKRFFKTVIPFLAWSVFALLWKYRKTLWAMVTGAPNNGLDWTFNSIVDGILNTKFQSIYWFFVPLFCIYLVIPFFAAIEEKKRIKIYTYAIIASTVLNYAIPFLLGLLGKYAEFKMYSTYTFFPAHQYLIYVLLGYVLHKKELRLKYRVMIYISSVIGLLAHLLGTYYASRAEGAVIGTFKGYYALPCLMYSAGVYLFLKNVSNRIKSEKVNRFFSWFQSYTFPIYLIHRYFLDVFEENIHFINLPRASLLYVVGATVLALLLSVLTTMLLRKIPLLRRIVP